MAGRAHPSNGGGQAASAAPFAAAAVAAAAAGADTVTAQLSPTSFLQLLDQQEQPHRAGDLVPDLRLGYKEDGGQEWLISFLGTLQGVEAVAAFLYGAGSRRAQQAEPILGSMCVGMYTLLEKLLHVRNPWGLAVSTTSKRLLHPEGQYRMGDVNLCGSDAFHAVLGKVAEQLAGFSERRLFEKPRLILEVHLADVGKVAALLLPFDRVRLLPPSGSRRRPRLPSLPAAASKYTEGGDGHCHCCGAGAGLRLKTCAKCGVARYCSKKCQVKDWQEEHRCWCSKLAEWRVGRDQAIQAMAREAGQAGALS